MAFDPIKKDDTKYTDVPVLSKIKIGDSYYYLKDADARLAVDSILADYLKGADKTELQGLITAEATARGDADTTLQGFIDALEEQVGNSTDVAKADGSLYARIKQEIADRAAAITQEVTDRNAAIASAIEALDVTDTAETGKYVSAVSEVDGKIQVTRADLPVAAEYSLAKEGTTPEGLAARYYLTKDNVKVGEYIDIAKDQFLKDAAFIAAATADDKAIDPTVIVGDPYIKFTFQTTGADRITYVAVKGLVDVYTAGDAIAITDNEISVKVKADDSYIEIDSNNQIATKGIDTAISTAVAAEAEIARAAEQANATAISNEVTRATGKEGELATAISAEETRAKAAEKANADAIDALDGRMDTAEDEIDTLQADMTQAKADIVTNAGAIATEKTRAEGQEATIRSEFAAADTTLDGKITAEATARAEADTAINTKIGAKTDVATAETVYGAIAAEKARAEAAEADLQEQIDDLDEGAFKDVTYDKNAHTLKKKIGELVSNVNQFGDLADENLANLEVKGQTKAVVFTSNSVDVKEYSVADAATSTGAEISRADYTPAGDVTVTLKDNTFNAITSVGTLPTYTDGSFSGGKATVIDTTKFNGGSAATFTEGEFTPATLTYAASDEFVKEGLKAEVGTGDDSECLIFSAVTNKGTASVISAFNGGSKAADTFNGGSAASLGDGFYTAGTDASYTAPTYVAGTLPQMASQTVAVNTAAFDGTIATGLQVTGVNYKKQVLNDSTVTKTVTVAGTVTTDDTAVSKKSTT